LKLIPNLLTSLRLAAAPLVAWLIVSGQFRTAVLALALAAVTDWLDGAAARRFGVSGRTGVVLDPLADKVMLVTLFLSLGYATLIPLWLLALVIGRDLVIVIGALLLRIFRGARKFMPSIAGKVSTFFQIVFALLALLNAAWPYQILGWLEMTALVLTTIFTAISGAGYVRLGIRMARREIPIY
jgi:cardiolipin synthase (CMP-forming)